MSKAKTQDNPGPEIDQLFSGHEERSHKKSTKHAYAVRKMRGPKSKAGQHGDLVILAHDGVDAHRQWFNYYGLHEDASLYRLRVLLLTSEKHDALISQAIECDAPRTEGGKTIDQIAVDQHAEIEQALQAAS